MRMKLLTSAAAIASLIMFATPALAFTVTNSQAAAASGSLSAGGSFAVSGPGWHSSAISGQASGAANESNANARAGHYGSSASTDSVSGQFSVSGVATRGDAFGGAGGVSTAGGGAIADAESYHVSFGHPYVD